MRLHILAFLTGCWIWTSTAIGQNAPAIPTSNNDSGNNDSAPAVVKQSNDTADGVVAPEPLLVWRFEGDELGTWKGAAKKADVGPRTPQYPAFDAENHAAFFAGDGASLVVRESDTPVKLRFGAGETITLEAWVRVKQISSGGYAYVIGKGRTLREPWADKNQNYALRIQGVNGRAVVNFLFASATDDGKPADWHRWSSKEGFAPGDGWHHVAVTYTFGKPKSIRGFVDGKPSTGTWDMGGETDRPPMQDADELWIGTGNGGGGGNSFHGWIDQLAIYRGVIPDQVMATRYQRVRIARQPKVAASPPPGKVLVELCESDAFGGNAWPEDPLDATETYGEDAFGFFETPHKYVDTGVRGERTIPYLLRATANVTFRGGKHRLLLRGRGASQLYIDGQTVLTLPFPPDSSDGHHEIPKDYLDLGPDFRFAPPGNRERWVEFTATPGPHLVMLESVVGSFTGSKPRRPELGEVVAAISWEGESSWQLVSPSDRLVPYTDEGWRDYERERREYLAQLNAKRRAELRQQHAAFWERRRTAAQEWLASTPEEPVPALPAGYPAQNAIDHFLAARIERAKQAEPVSGPVDFFRDVQPLLQAKCVSCHQGERAKGGLRLDRAEAARRGGDSGVPGLVPGKPADSEVIVRLHATGDDKMPPEGGPLKAEEIALLEKWVEAGAVWPALKYQSVHLTPLVDDLAFLRRVTLDTIGVVPSLQEIREFEADASPDKRARAIDRLLDDPRGADHWVGYWQDVLAENPNILNPTLNNTGPFRWWIYESLQDDKPLDLWVTELLRMRGSDRLGGPAGFAVASQNDVPMAAKGTIVSTAFLGVEMKCARCHDSPYHASSQRDLFELGAMLGDKEIDVPKTSSVPMDKLHQGGRKPLISVTLAPGTKVVPRWPFPKFVSEDWGAKLAEYPAESRDRLAALITAPGNERFAQVMANRIWQRLMARGLVEPVEDWEKGEPTHPELLRWLGRELVRSGYQAKHVARLILNSHAYQRAIDPQLREPHPLYAAPAPRRLTAEQLVDSLFASTGKAMGTEEVSLDIDGQRDMGNSISLGRPTRSWMFASTSNERDRPSLSLPRVQAVVDVLAAFGWRPARQDPASRREQASNILQPAVLANGVISVWLTRLSADHGITQLAVSPNLTPDEFLDQLFLRLLTRRPTNAEREAYLTYLTPGFAERIVANAETSSTGERRPPRYVSWSNHLSEEANAIKLELEAAARRGDPPTMRLAADWRERAEDVLWSLLNAPEWIYVP